MTMIKYTDFCVFNVYGMTITKQPSKLNRWKAQFAGNKYVINMLTQSIEHYVTGN